MQGAGGNSLGSSGQKLRKDYFSSHSTIMCPTSLFLWHKWKGTTFFGDRRWNVEVGGNMWKKKNTHASQRNTPQTWDVIKQANNKIPPSQQNIKHCELKCMCLSAHVEPFGICSTLWAVPRYCTSLLVNWASVIQSFSLNKMSGLKFDLMMSESLKAVWTEWSKTTPPFPRVLTLRALKQTVKSAVMVLRVRMI